jgi:hypothetical protein
MLAKAVVNVPDEADLDGRMATVNSRVDPAPS